MQRASRPWPSVMDAAEIPLAEVYAEAALELVPSEAEAEEASGELNELARFLRDTPQLNYLLFRAPISVAARCGLVDRVFRQRCSPVAEGLLKVLTRRDRLVLFPVIAARFRALLDRREGKVDVTVTTAVEMDDQTRRQVIQTMRERHGALPALHELVDPSLVGGMVVSVGGRVYDDSIATELDRMCEKLVASIARKQAAGEAG
jgi:F-type H+-transporting ATPase subunit delta